MLKEQLLQTFEATQDATLESWSEFLSFKSISTDSAFEADCRSCADWLVQRLQQIGFKSELIETDSKPLVYAEFKPSQSTEKTVLYYGHYDVQPADPLELWTSDPFKAELRDGRLYARGAEDNKGQTFYVIRALENLIKNDALKLNVKLLIEGEEETGSSAIKKTLPLIQDRIKADTLMVCDTGSLSSEFATITMGLRGILSFDIRLDGPKYDLHSGVHGGIIPNPATELARLIATLHDENGKIAVAGYYDEMTKVIPKDLELANSAPFDLSHYETQVGVSAVGGEKGLSFVERRGFRPTLEVNGLVSGYGGEGGKTIIPSHAIAKISARIAAGQDADKCLERIETHLKKHVNPALKLTLPYKKVGGDALYLSSETEIVKKAKDVLDQIFDKPTAFMWEGASIPIIPDVAKYSGAEPLVIGFGLEEDLIHAPNESFSIEQFKHGFLYVSLLLQKLGE